MSRRVAVLGIAEHVRPAGTAQNLEDMIFRTARGALEATGIRRDEVGGIVIAASDQTDGRAISSMLTAGPAGAYLNDEINIASSPGHAFVMACLAIMSGMQRRVLLSSWGSASETATAGGSEAAERLSTDPYYERDVLAPLAIAAFQAAAQRRRDSGEDGARAVVAKSAANAGRGGASAVGMPLAYPLREDEVAKPCDGAFSLLLAADDALVGDEEPVWVSGIGWSSDSSRTPSRDLLTLPPLRQAARNAYALAGVAGAGEVDVFELHDYTADAELLACEAVGVCRDGEAPRLAVEGVFAREGARPVNVGGGSLAGEAPFGGPLRKVQNAVRQLREGPPRRALVQIAGGLVGQFQTVIVLERGEAA